MLRRYSVTQAVLITGASQGIGAAIAVAFAGHKNSEGEPAFRLALVSRNIEALQRVQASCQKLGSECEVFPCDLTCESQVTTMAQRVLADLGVPDLLINNAGQFVQGDLIDMDLQRFRSTIDTNLTSAFLTTRAFLPGMIERKSGAIFYMASVASQKAYPNCGAYTVAKHGLLGLARSIRESTRTAGLRVSSILPGATDTPSWAGENVSPSRLMPPSDIAQIVLSLFTLSHRSVVEEIVLRPLLGDL